MHSKIKLYFRGRGRRKILPITGADGENSISIIAHRDGYRRNTQTFSADGITEALDTGQGGGRGHHIAIPCFCDMNYGAGVKLTENTRTLQSRYYKGISNHAGETSGVAIKIIAEVNSSQDGKVHDVSEIAKCHSAGHNNSPKVAIPVLTPDRTKKRQNGRRFKENDDPMFTLTAQDRHGVGINISGHNVTKLTNVCSCLNANDQRKIFGAKQERTLVGLKIKEATLKGYDEALQGDSICNQGTQIILSPGNIPNVEDQKGVYVELPNGVICYAIWYEKEQCYITIRKLTPKECFRLQGWTDDYFEKAAFVNSDSRLYMQAGNGVTVDVVYAIGKKIEEREKESLEEFAKYMNKPEKGEE